MAFSVVIILRMTATMMTFRYHDIEENAVAAGILWRLREQRLADSYKCHCVATCLQQPAR